MSRNARFFWSFFVSSVVIDQLTKIWVYTHLKPASYAGPGDVVTVIPGFLDIIQAQNPGAAFSILRNFEYRYVVFLGFVGIAIYVVWDQFKRLKVGDTWMAIALGLIASGAVGNGIDRIHKRTVTDFVSVHIEQPAIRRWLVDNLGTNVYPTFNVADAALLIGVILFLIVGWRAEAAEKAAKKAATTTPPTA